MNSSISCSPSTSAVSGLIVRQHPSIIIEITTEAMFAVLHLPELRKRFSLALDVPMCNRSNLVQSLASLKQEAASRNAQLEKLKVVNNDTELH